MAREIHDTIAHGLTGIVTQLEAAEQAEDRPEARQRHVANAIRLARESLSEARRSVEASRPEVLEGASLEEALADVAERWSDLSGVPVDVTTTGEPMPLHPEIEIALLRTAQEALANVAKHATASRALLTLSYMGDEVTLDVRDDGVGFEVPAEASPGRGAGFGLTAMRQRVSRVAGTLAIESEPGGGTAISARVPAIGAATGGVRVVSPIRLLIVDDHPVVRDGLRGIFEGDPEFEVLGEAADGAEAVDLAESLRPDVVLMDLRMPGVDGATAIRQLAERGNPARVLVLTTYETDADVVPAIEAGAIGYLLKDSPRAELYRAVRAAHLGESVLAPSVARLLVRQFRAPGAGCVERARARGAVVDRAGGDEPWDGRASLHLRGHGEDPPASHLREARGERSSGCGRDGVRARSVGPSARLAPRAAPTSWSGARPTPAAPHVPC